MSKFLSIKCTKSERNQQLFSTTKKKSFFVLSPRLNRAYTLDLYRLYNFV